MTADEEQKVESLYEKLKAYAGTEYYPYHMPGHKRKPLTEVLAHIGEIDVTEIEGFDNLHHAEGILQDMQARAAELYGAEESHYLVNGSTCGILAAISSAIPEGGHILMARNCHKAAYHGVYLRRLRVSYLLPEAEEGFDILKGITKDQVEKALQEHPDVQAVLIVSPTYEGAISDINGIAGVIHGMGIPLIVDEAHGAHLGFHSAWPENSCRSGADIVIHSLHKTMPSMTQTAVLHVNGDRVDREKLRRFLSIYQSSSPSYVMMASMQQALELAAADRETLFGKFLKLWDHMLEKLEKCRFLRIRKESGMDIGKLVVSVRGTNLTGQQLYNILLKKYHLQMEMAAGTYVLAMFTVADEREGYERLTQALLEIDGECRCGEEKITEMPDRLPVQAMSLAEAWDGEKEEVAPEQAAGRIAGEFIHLYPPGIPVVAPGEVIPEELGARIVSYAQQGLPVHGVRVNNDGIRVGVLV